MNLDLKNLSLRELIRLKDQINEEIQLREKHIVDKSYKNTIKKDRSLESWTNIILNKDL